MRKEDWPYSNPFDPECLQTFFDPDDLSITGTRLWYGSDGDIGGTEQYTWEPLTDDGDALRLAVKLGLVVEIDTDLGGETQVWPYGNPPGSHTNDHGNDPYAATRRAIVRAAAAIGKEMS